MGKRGIAIVLILAVLISLSFASANIFSDLWNQITGHATATAVCGNGIKETGELCDYAASDPTNNPYGDQCSTNCWVNGAPPYWSGCRGNGANVCVDAPGVTDQYYIDHPNCIAATTCAGLFYNCNGIVCPPPSTTTPGSWCSVSELDTISCIYQDNTYSIQRGIGCNFTINGLAVTLSPDLSQPVTLSDGVQVSGAQNETCSSNPFSLYFSNSSGSTQIPLPPPENTSTVFWCGNGIVDQSTEQCDGNDLGGKTCSSLGYSGGTLKCTSTCILDTSQCTNGTFTGYIFRAGFIFSVQYAYGVTGAQCVITGDPVDCSSGSVTYGSQTGITCTVSNSLYQIFSGAECIPKNNTSQNQTSNNTPNATAQGTTTQTGTDQNLTCDGCKTDHCYPFGYRKSGQYCSVNSLSFVQQLPESASCQNNFECGSNLCLNSQCVSQSLIQKIIDWINGLLGGNGTGGGNTNTTNLTLVNKVIKDPVAAQPSDLVQTVDYYNKIIDSGTENSTDLDNRKAVMVALAEKDPAKFLDNVMNQKTREKLSADQQKLVEKPLSMQGEILVATADDFENNISKEYYSIQNSSRIFGLWTDGNLSYEPGSNISVSGFNIEGYIVANSSNISLIRTAKPTSTTTRRNVLVILWGFQDVGLQDMPTKEQVAQNLFNGGFLDQYYRNVSENKFTFTGTVVGWYVFPGSDHRGGHCAGAMESWINYGFNQFDYRALLATAARDVDVDAYDTVVIVPDTNCYVRSWAFGGGGIISDKYMGEKYFAVVSGRYLNIATSPWDFSRSDWRYFDFIMAHELGHTLGLVHANSFLCQSNVLDDSCRFTEYGNVWDTMGGGASENSFFKEDSRSQLGYDIGSSPIIISGSGLYTLPYYNDLGNAQYAKTSFPIGNFLGNLAFEYRRLIDDSVDTYTDNINLNGLAVLPYSLYFPETLVTVNKSTVDRNGDAFFLLDPGLSPGEPPIYDSYNGVTIGPVWSMNKYNITFEVRYPGDGPYTTLRASSSGATKGSSVTIYWESSPDAYCLASSTTGTWSGKKKNSGQDTITVNSPGTYTLRCSAGKTVTTKSIIIALTYDNPIISFTASPSTISSGGTTTLSWNTAPNSVCYGSWAPGITVSESGSYSFSPIKTLSYSLSCSWNGKLESQSVTVNVGSSVPDKGTGTLPQ